MWYLKDYQGNVTGPYELTELIESLKQPFHYSNASLVRHGERGTWKPAMIAFPDVYTEDPKEDTQADLPNFSGDPASPNPYIPPVSISEEARTEDGDKQHSTTLTEIAKDLNRTRIVMATATFYASLLLIAILNRASVQHLDSKSSSLTLGNSMIVCVIFMVFPLSVLINVIRRKTDSTPSSIHTTVSLHRKFWSSMLIAATLSVVLTMFVLLNH